MLRLSGPELGSGRDTWWSAAADPLNHISWHSEQYHFEYSRCSFFDQHEASNTCNIHTSTRHGDYLRDNTPRRPRLHQLHHVSCSVLQPTKRISPAKALRIINSNSLVSLERDPWNISMDFTHRSTKQRKQCTGEILEEEDGSSWHVYWIGGFQPSDWSFKSFLESSKMDCSRTSGSQQ